MDAYDFRGALFCASCADELKLAIPLDRWPACEKCGHLAGEHGDASCAALGCACTGYDASDDVGSGVFPAGPYPNGGGEADTAQHCAECGEALDNPVIAPDFEYAGSIISGTMRSEDVGPALLECLESLAPDRAEAWRKDWASIEKAGFSQAMIEAGTDGDVDFAIGDLFEALGDLTLEGWYFGAHPGDPADYGFWRSHELG